MDKPYEDLPTYREQMKKSQLKQIWEEANKKETKISLPQKKVEITNEMTGYKKQPLKDSTIEKISNPDLFVENLAKNNQSYIEKY